MDQGTQNEEKDEPNKESGAILNNPFSAKLHLLCIIIVYCRGLNVTYIMITERTGALL